MVDLPTLVRLWYWLLRNSLFCANFNVAGVVNNEPEQSLLNWLNCSFNPWIAGILLSCDLGSSHEYTSAHLLISSSSITEDFYKGFIRPKASEKN